jgi:hypothetical protein
MIHFSVRRPYRDRRCGCDGTRLDLRDQRGCLAFRLDVEFGAQFCRQRAGAPQRCVAADMPRQKTNQQALRALAQRIERDQPFGCPDRLFAVAGLVLAQRVFFERDSCHGLEARAFSVNPVVEHAVVGIEPIEKRPGIEAHCPFQIGNVLRAGQRQELAGIGCDQAGIERNRLAVDLERLKSRGLEFPAQVEKALPQVLPRLPLRAFAPQQRGQPFAGFRKTWLHRQIGQQRPALPACDRDGARGCSDNACREPAEELQSDTAGFGHSQSVQEAGFRNRP